MSNSVQVCPVITSIELLMAGFRELGVAIQDLRESKKELQMLENCAGQKVPVDYVVQNEAGDKIGISQKKSGEIEFVVQHEDRPSVKATLDRVTQAYARLKILDEVKQKGYRSVKEERLANGSIRLVVEKWQ
ncbi:DUF1257 domain-containing protein [bacterium]|nr:DUF1257 domain-containing protein [bacterium]